MRGSQEAFDDRAGLAGQRGELYAGFEMGAGQHAVYDLTMAVERAARTVGEQLERHCAVFLQRQWMFAQHADAADADIEGTHGELTAVAARQGCLDAQGPARSMSLVYIEHGVLESRRKIRRGESCKKVRVSSAPSNGSISGKLMANLPVFAHSAFFYKKRNTMSNEFAMPE